MFYRKNKKIRTFIYTQLRSPNSEAAYGLFSEKGVIR